MLGVVDFARYVTSHGGTMFYVSNRDQKDFDATIANLKHLGFLQVNAQRRAFVSQNYQRFGT